MDGRAWWAAVHRSCQGLDTTVYQVGNQMLVSLTAREECFIAGHDSLAAISLTDNNY